MNRKDFYEKMDRFFCKLFFRRKCFRVEFYNGQTFLGYNDIAYFSDRSFARHLGNGWFKILKPIKTIKK